MLDISIVQKLACRIYTYLWAVSSLLTRHRASRPPIRLLLLLSHLQGLICRVVKLLYISRHHKREPNFYLEFHHDHRTSEILQSVLSSCARQNTSHTDQKFCYIMHTQLPRNALYHRVEYYI